MRTLLIAVAIGCLAATPAPALAQDSASDTASDTASAQPPLTFPEPLPPPDLDAPGVDTDAGDAAPPQDIDALPPKVDAPGDPPPEVTIRTDSGTGDVVEEYRQNGVVYMVRVRPPNGPEYMLLDTNGDGRLDSRDGEGPVRPVYWTLYEWE